MKLHPFIITALFIASFVRAEEEEKPPTEVAVQVAKITRSTLRRAVTAYGVIEAEPNASARLAPAVAGILAEVNGIEGQKVKKGDVLFRLDSRAVDAAAAKAAEETHRGGRHVGKAGARSPAGARRRADRTRHREGAAIFAQW
jgi:multidrug efflux pump subunit AcrA (membrane-fusion protein)